MKKTLILFGFICLSLSSLSQGINNLWLMGYECCQPLFSTMDLNFETGSLVISQTQRSMEMNTTNGEICDSSGRLLFYTNGIYIANSLDDTMQNGSGLNPSFFTTNHTLHGLTIPQANLIIPFPGDSSKYYLFHQTIDDFLTYCSLHLYYSIVDMTLDGGLGAVIQKNSVLLTDSLVPGRIAACKHANGRDWWIFVHQFHSGLMYKYLVSASGIQGPFVQDLITWRDIGVGQAVFSKQGNKFVYYEPYDDLDIWDFDRCTGDFSNLVHIDINDSAISAGAAFSPSGKYLYVSSEYYLYQFDMDASNIDSSRITVGIYDNYQPHGFYAIFYLAQLAPDGKIYINTADATDVLHVINYPDSAGVSCNFCQHCIQLPAFNAFTIPNFPNYFLGAEGGTICDSLPTGIGTVRKPVNDYSIFPNPSTVDLYVNLGNEKIESALMYNSLGQIVSITSDLIKNEYIHFNVAGLENGFYYIELLTQNQKIVRTFVKQ